MKKGFTLVELLAVITLLALIVVISLPAIINKINNHEKELSKALYETVMAASRMYVENNPDKIGIATHHVKFNTLVQEDLLDSSILTDYKDYCVKISYRSNQYNYEIESSCTEG